MNVLLLNASPHGEASHGCQLERELIATIGGDAAREVTLVTRDLTAEPLPPITRDYAMAITSREPDVAQFAVSDALIAELEAADVLVINTPMHNFTVPASLKLWLDYVIRIHRTFASTPDGKIGLLRDRPVFVLIGSGGFHAGERARQPDFLTPYLRHALATIGIHSVECFLLQGLVMGDEMVAAARDDARTAMQRFAPFAASAVERAA